MKLIVGLGNPGKQYENTHHNIGFMALDYFAALEGVCFKVDSALKAMVATVVIDGTKALLVKPLTYKNLSGESIYAVMKYYKIALEDLLVISDDLDRPTGRIRLRENGSSGGHNGHKSIMQHLNSQTYKRIKIGIGRDERTPVVDWVLRKNTKEEAVIFEESFKKVALALKDFILDVPFHRIASLYSSK